MESSYIPVPVPELIKVILAPLWWDAIPFIDKLLLLPRGHSAKAADILILGGIL